MLWMFIVAFASNKARALSHGLEPRATAALAMAWMQT
jgi:hypothetical protein